MRIKRLPRLIDHADTNGPGRPFVSRMPHGGYLKIVLFLFGLIGAFGFAPYYLWPMTAVSIGAAYYLLRDRGYRYSFWWGAGYAISNFYWCASPILENQGSWHFYIAAMIGIFVAWGLVFATPFVMTSATRATGWRRTLYFALAWTFVLWLREWILFCPWNPLANIMLPIPRISNAMSVIGALGLTFILAGCIAAIPEYFKSRQKWQLLFFIPLLFFAFVYRDGGMGIENGKYVRMVQPVFSVSAKRDPNAKEIILASLLELSSGKSSYIPDMIIWPETAYPYNANINTRMPALKTVFVSGAVYRDGEKFYNSLLRMDPNGRIVDSYHKVRLVPFGEYRPFGDWIKSPGDFTHGAGPKMIDDFVPAICYEIAYSDSLIPRHAGAQAKYILNITSDVWLQNSSGVPQHVDMARRQAIETGLPVVFSNYTGISAIIDNRGGILRSIAYGEVGFMDGPIPPHKITMYRKIGLNRIMLGLAILCGFILIVFRKRRND